MPQGPEHVDAVEIGEPDIEDDEVKRHRCLLRDLTQGVGAGACFDDGKPIVLEVGAQDLADLLLIVDDEQSAGHGAGRGHDTPAATTASISASMSLA